LETHTLFGVYIKDFDRVLRRNLWDIMTERGHQGSTVRTVLKYVYERTAIGSDRVINIRQKTEMINKGVSHDCPLSPSFITCMDADTPEWQMQLESHFSVGTMTLDTLLFIDDLVIFAESEDELQMATLRLGYIMTTYNLEILYDKT
jgi:hypothetical protein